MTKSFMRLSVISLSGFLIALLVCSKSFAFLPGDDSWQPTRILYSNIKGYFGDLRGTYRLYDTKLSQQIVDGLQIDQLSGRQVVQLPKVGNGLYLESGSTGLHVPSYLDLFPLFSAVLITPSEKVVSAAMLDSAGLVIFLRPSEGNSLYVHSFKKWAQGVWCNEADYVGLGYNGKSNQKFDPSRCRPLGVQIVYLSGYGNKSVN